MRDTTLDVLATLFGLQRGEFAPGDYEDDGDLARRIHVAARHGRSRQAIATMAFPIGHLDVVEGLRSGFRPEVAGTDPVTLNMGSNAAAAELACVFCHRPGRVRAEGFAPECDACASS